MKILCEVDSPSQVAEENKEYTFFIHNNDTRDLQEALEMQTGKVFLYITADVDCSRLLKLIEDYQGDMVVYVAGTYSEVFASRFTTAVSKRDFGQIQEFPVYTPMEVLFREAKAAL